MYTDQHCHRYKIAKETKRYHTNWTIEDDERLTVWEKHSWEAKPAKWWKNIYKASTFETEVQYESYIIMF